MFTARRAVVIAAALLVAAGCGDIVEGETAAPPDAAPGFPVTIAASNGDIEIPTLPVNIVSMSATHTEMLYAIGAGDQVVAVDAFSN